MTLTLPDLATPAQPPTGGVPELLAFIALSGALYLFGAGALAALAAALN